MSIEQQAALGRSKSVTCPFFESSSAGSDDSCVAPSHQRISVTPIYASEYCLTARHEECALFMHAKRSRRLTPDEDAQPAPETQPAPSPPVASPTGQRAQPVRFGRLQAAVVALVLAVNALTAVVVTRSLLPASSGHGTALVAPVRRHVHGTVPVTSVHRAPPVVLGARATPIAQLEQSWSFPAVPSLQGRTVLVLYNPAARPVEAHLRIDSGGSTYSHTVRIRPGSVVRLHLAPGAGSSAVKLQSDRYIVPVRLATG